MAISTQFIDELLKDYNSPDNLLDDNASLQQLTKALRERALQGKLTHHLRYEKHSPKGKNTDSSRNGSTPKTLKGKGGQVSIDVPRDRAGEFEPELIKKNQTCFDGLGDKIISLYAIGRVCRAMPLLDVTVS